jgi:hypothetical protein
MILGFKKGPVVSSPRNWMTCPNYGLLANRYVEGFEQKWVLGDTTEADELLGSGDIQSLADLGNSYAAVKEMRPVPFDLQDIGRLAAATAVPLLPLGFTVFSLEELVTRILKSCSDRKAY